MENKGIEVTCGYLLIEGVMINVKAISKVSGDSNHVEIFYYNGTPDSFINIDKQKVQNAILNYEKFGEGYLGC